MMFGLEKRYVSAVSLVYMSIFAFEVSPNILGPPDDPATPDLAEVSSNGNWQCVIGISLTDSASIPKITN